MINQVCGKGYRNNPIITEQKANNGIKSKTIARFEPVFGFIERSMKGFYVWLIRQPIAISILGLISQIYNIFRYEQLVRKMA